MHNKLSAFLFVIILLGAMVCLTHPAISAQQADNAIISSGGATNLHDNAAPFSIHDLKGQAAAGTHPTIGNIKLEMGGLYGLIGENLPPLENGKGGIVIKCLSENGAPIAGQNFSIKVGAAAPLDIASTNLGNCLVANLDPAIYTLQITFNNTVVIIPDIQVSANKWTFTTAIFVTNPPPNGGGIAATLLENNLPIVNNPFNYSLIGPTSKNDQVITNQLGLVKIDGLDAGNYGLSLTKANGAHGFANDIPVLNGAYTCITINFSKLPWGTIPLSITKNGKDLQITWDDFYPQPQIFISKGTGGGDYDGENAYQDVKWTKIAEDGDLFVNIINNPNKYGVFEYAEGMLTHKTQVSNPLFPEIYYKALQKDVPKNGVNPDTGLKNLASAWAVGKINITINPGVTVLSTPLKSQGNSTLDDIFGSNQLEVGDEIYYKPAANSPNTVKAVLKADGWYNGMNLNEKSAVHVSNLFGYWLNSKANKPITFVGEVINLDQLEVPINVGVTALGIAFPKTVPLSNSNFIECGAIENDELYFKPSAESPNTLKAILKNNIWKNGSKPAEELVMFDLKPTAGYVYNHKEGNIIHWKQNKPWE